MGIWDVLEMSPTLDVNQIRKSYASLAKKYHPEEAPEKFQELQEAYKEALKRAKKRKKEVTVSESFETETYEIETPEELFSMLHSNSELIKEEKQRRQKEAKVRTFFEAFDLIYKDCYMRERNVSWDYLIEEELEKDLLESEEFLLELRNHMVASKKITKGVWKHILSLLKELQQKEYYKNTMLYLEAMGEDKLAYDEDYEGEKINKNVTRLMRKYITKERYERMSAVECDYLYAKFYVKYELTKQAGMDFTMEKEIEVPRRILPAQKEIGILQGILYVLVIGILVSVIIIAIRGKGNSGVSNDPFPSIKNIPKEVWENYPEILEKQNQMMEEWRNNSNN